MRNRRSYKGKYKLRHPEKYIGNATNIVFRSLLEYKYMQWLDTSPSVVRWASEELPIPYLSPLDKQIHRYFVDFYVELKGSDQEIKQFLVEIKPESQTRQPKKPANPKKRYFREYSTWLVNKAKWEAATKLCEEHNWQFKIITDKDIHGR